MRWWDRGFEWHSDVTECAACKARAGAVVQQQPSVQRCLDIRRNVLRPRLGSVAAHIATNISNQPVDISESENPVQVLHCGFCDPLERDPQAVIVDIRNEKISREYAACKYGVVILHGELQADAGATASTRVRLQAERKPVQGIAAVTTKS